MKNKITSISPGKLIVTGEHSVVYGEPALLTAIDLSTAIKIEVGGKDVGVVSPNLGVDERFEIDDLRRFWREAKNAWQLFFDLGDSDGLKSFQKDPLVIVKSSLGMIFDELGVCGGVEVEISSNIPVGSGLGSSASVAAALIGGILSFFETEFSLEELSKKTHEVEKIIHGNPSGGDNTIVVHGGGIEFRKIKGKPSFSPISIQNIQGYMALIDSGKPKETTGEMVMIVSEYVKKGNENTIEQMGEVSRGIISKLKNGEMDKNLIKENQNLLNKIGVVGSVARNMVKMIEESGGVAKVCGAGGRKNGSGIVLVYDDDLDRLQYILNKLQKPIYKTKLGEKGWHLQK